jgi:hypothetical protein
MNTVEPSNEAGSQPEATIRAITPSYADRLSESDRKWSRVENDDTPQEDFGALVERKSRDCFAAPSLKIPHLRAQVAPLLADYVEQRRIPHRSALVAWFVVLRVK